MCINSIKKCSVSVKICINEFSITTLIITYYTICITLCLYVLLSNGKMNRVFLQTDILTSSLHCFGNHTVYLTTNEYMLLYILSVLRNGI